MKRILLSAPHISVNELKYIERAINREEVSNYGENIEAFQNISEKYLEQNTFIACLSSGTAALHLALIQSGVTYGDEVLCQSFTFSASANPIVYQGANPIFIDSEPDTWNMCPVHLEEAINDRIKKGKKPKAIILVHLYGMPAKLEDILTIAKDYNIPLIEDAAEALGSIYKGQKCGTFGEFGVLSFNGNKIITTSGGGALVCKTKEAKQKTIFLATQSRDNAPHYQHTEIGYNYRMSNIVAGIGRGQMEVLDKHIALRRKNNQFYKNLFNDFEGVEVFTEPSSDYFSNHWLSCITINKSKVGFSREDLRLKLLEGKIESRPLWKPMHLQPVFSKYPYYGDKVSEMLFEKGLCLPSGSNLTQDDLNRIEKVIFSFKR